MSEVPDVAGGDVITSAHMNTVKNRTIQRYDDAAARDTAVPSPQEGDLAFLRDTEKVTVYAGPNWETAMYEIGGQFTGPVIFLDTVDIQSELETDGIQTDGDILFNGTGTVTGIAAASMSTIPPTSGSFYISEVTGDGTLGNATVLSIRSSAVRCLQIAVEKNGAAMFFRGINGDGPNWGSWTQVATV